MSTVQATGGAIAVRGGLAHTDIGAPGTNHRWNASAHRSIAADCVRPFMATIYHPINGYFQHDRAPRREAEINLGLVFLNTVMTLVFFSDLPSRPTGHRRDAVGREACSTNTQLTDLQKLRHSHVNTDQNRRAKFPASWRMHATKS